jgi:hypothetical protein
VDHTDDPDDRLTRIDELLRVELSRPDFLFPSLNYGMKLVAAASRPAQERLDHRLRVVQVQRAGVTSMVAVTAGFAIFDTSGRDRSSVGGLLALRPERSAQVRMPPTAQYAPQGERPGPTGF